jgi:hypothetical protein
VEESYGKVDASYNCAILQWLGSEEEVWVWSANMASGGKVVIIKRGSGGTMMVVT